MKSMSFKALPRAYCTVALLFIMILLQSCYNDKYEFTTSSVVPAAEGAVKVKKDDNGNYRIDLHVTQLAEANRLTPPKELYVVWLKTEENKDINIGQLKTATHFPSKTLKSSLNTTSSYKPVGFFVTGELEADVLYPDMRIVLETE